LGFFFFANQLSVITLDWPPLNLELLEVSIIHSVGFFVV